ncbi:antirepressor [Floricoccus tropicus]|uniref:Antirepressor n=1 Tax=Floricoccus tropicus TaxID=1859473 RepID=A0A1E8GKT0_9LACT|nr:ORF6N domain-containing protein [Floricoccus tropicus]OFI48854.1 antirepressor [Floricoccus tropicus]
MESIKVISYQSKRVLTTQQLAEGYGAKSKLISKNFNNNKERYEEGKHYIVLEGEDLKKFSSESPNLRLAKNINKLYLWTENGAFLHAKSLNTDQAWNMYEKLIDTYFKVQDLKEVPSSPRELAKLALAANEEVNERVDMIDTRLTEIEENKSITTEDYGTIGRNVSKKVHKIISERHLGLEARRLLFTDLNSSIKQVFNAPNRGRIKDKDFESVLDFIRSWEPSSVTNAKLKELGD